MHLYFLHIPKTAGTSLDILFKLQYSKKDRHPWDNKDFPKLQNQYRENILQPQEFKVLKGHYKYGIHKYFSKTEDYKYLTILRDPVSRVKSHIRQYLRMPNSFIYKEYEKHKDLHKIIDENRIYGFSNLQTCWIAGENYVENSEMEEVYNKALSNIEKEFFYVGVVELFNESLYQIYKKINWKYRPYYSSLNKSSKEEIDEIKFDSRTIKLIEDLNFYDIKLYNKFRDKVVEDHFNQDKKEFENYIRRLGYFQKLHKGYLQIKNIL
ncbi:sulfotransferase family 2 domain-containing protein [Aegicerativicinus sediminis]|uniref:sulfotransferase family 2 domain-containing protein n=1 Tax=Aegicerativicinus sediminis TaxID=2893202 RepID=UPI001E61D5DF|nr:sulfotransferase family 2 domain-containing protein [Aegicerativicinus sediminis]